MTKAEWARMRKIIREEVQKLLAEALTESLGGYDGATTVIDDDWAEEGQQRRIGFRVPTGAFQDS